jgi:hypothetical protein
MKTQFILALTHKNCRFSSYEKLRVAQLVKEFPAFYGTQSLITVSIAVRHFIRSQRNPIHTLTSYFCKIHFDVTLRCKMLEHPFFKKSCHSSVDIATRLRAGRSDFKVFDSRRGLRIFHFTTVSMTALGPTQRPIQWLPGALSLRVKRPGRGADHSPPSSAEVKECVEL